MLGRSVFVAGATVALSLLTLSAACGEGGAGGPIKPGDSCRPFDVYDVTGPKKGKTLCYV
jgi:hypothetical protein